MRERHELTRFEECSLFNSGHEYRDGYSRAVCSCGWKSTAAKGHPACVALFALHAKRADRGTAA